MGLLCLMGVAGCKDGQTATAEPSQTETQFDLIADQAALDHLMVSAGKRVLVIDFFADWCAPCRLVTPTLQAVAREVADIAVFYAVDVDANRDLTQRMGVAGIPNVILIKEGVVIKKLQGVLSKETYLAAIQEASR